MSILLAILIWAATVGAWTFVIGYSVLARWWRTEAGRHMWSFSLMIALLLTLIVGTGLLGHDYPGRVWVRIGAYGLLAVMIWHRVALLVRLQVRRRREVPSGDPRDGRGGPT